MLIIYDFLQNGDDRVRDVPRDRTIDIVDNGAQCLIIAQKTDDCRQKYEKREQRQQWHEGHVPGQLKTIIVNEVLDRRSQNVYRATKNDHV